MIRNVPHRVVIGLSHLELLVGGGGGDGRGEDKNCVC